MSKGETIISHVLYIFLVFYVQWKYILGDSMFIKVVSQ